MRYHPARLALALAALSSTFLVATSPADTCFDYDGEFPMLVDVSAYGPEGGSPKDIVVHDHYGFVPWSIGDAKVYDLSTPGMLQYAGLLNGTVGTKSVFIQGTLLYAAGGSPGLRIFDITDPISPVLLGDDATPAVAERVVGAGSLALVLDASLGLLVYDVSTPTTPDLLGSASVAANSKDLAVVGSTVYVVDYSPDVEIVDISDPTAPTVATTYVAPDGVECILADGDLLMLGFTDGGVQLLDVSDPLLPDPRSTVPTPGGVRDLDVAGDILHVAEANEIRMVDISSASTTSVVGAVAGPGNFRRVAVADGMAYVTYVQEGGALYSFDVDPPASPLATEASALEGLEDAVVEGDLAYVGAGENGFKVVDLSNPTAPVVIGQIATPPSGAVVLNGQLAYTTLGAELHVIDISDPTVPVHVSSQFTPALPVHFDVEGSYLYVTMVDWGLIVYDLSDPEQPVLIAFEPVPHGLSEILVHEGFAYVAGRYFTVIDISDPTDPELVSTHGVFGDHITRVGDVAYLTTISRHLFAFDISTPGAPVQLGFVDTIESDDVYVDSDVAFVTTGSAYEAVNVVDVSDPANMQLVASISVPGGGHAIAGDGGPAILAGYVISDPCEPIVGVHEPSQPSTPPGIVVHPQPARGAVTLEIDLARSGTLAVRVFDTAGRRVRELRAGPRSVGPQRVGWDGRDDGGRRLPSGVYLVRVADESGEVLGTARVVLTR